MLSEALLENHLAFSGASRGNVVREPGSIRIESPMPGFSCLIPVGPEPRLADCDQIRLVPWSGVDPETLRGYVRSNCLSFMVLGDTLGGTSSPEVGISLVRDESAMDTFTSVQVRGFGAADPAMWIARVGPINRRNLSDPRQLFYLGSVDGTPCGVTLLLITGEVAGIYTVATLPEARRRGVSTTLLHRAVTDARERGCKVVSLQVIEGSPAHGLYRSLGFRDVFASPLFVRAR